MTKSHGHTFQTQRAKARIAAILTMLDQHGTLQSHKLAYLLGWPPTTLANYLPHMYEQEMIVPDDPTKERDMFWSRPDEHGKPSVLPTAAELVPVPYLRTGANPALSSGKPIVRRTNAADFKADVPTDPMSQFLYGARKTA